MIEEEPGRSRLRAFKQCIERARVRDSFTTPENLGLRIATSVGRYIAVAQSSGGQNTRSLLTPLALASVAGTAVAQALATVFVDLMRLMYVVSSGAARQANEKHYSKFVGMAERHLEELRGSLAQFATALDSTSHQRSVVLQRRISFMLDRLKAGPSDSLKATDYWVTMRETVDLVDAFCLGVAGEAYSKEVEIVERTLNKIGAYDAAAVGLWSLDEIFRFRLATQTRVLEQSRISGESTLFSIADDMDSVSACDTLSLTVSCSSRRPPNSALDPSVAI